MTAEERALKVLQYLTDEEGPRVLAYARRIDMKKADIDDMAAVSNYYLEAEIILRQALELAMANVEDQIDRANAIEDRETKFAAQRGVL